MIFSVYKKIGRHEIDLLQYSRAKLRTGWLQWVAEKILRNRNLYTIYLRDGTKLGLTAEEKEQLDSHLRTHRKILGLMKGVKDQRFAYKHGANE